MAKLSNKQHKSEVTDAVRHIGPTIESEEEKAYFPDTGPSTPDNVIAEERSAGNVSVHRVTEDLRHEHKTDAEPEPLITHLEGDTSSDPHTDVGPDNATTARAHSEEKPDRQKPGNKSM
jgi:hypothetical protein